MEAGVRRVGIISDAHFFKAMLAMGGGYTNSLYDTLDAHLASFRDNLSQTCPSSFLNSPLFPSPLLSPTLPPLEYAHIQINVAFPALEEPLVQLGRKHNTKKQEKLDETK